MKGKATHPQRLDPPLDCQDVSRYQAVNPDPMYWASKSDPLSPGERWLVVLHVAMSMTIILIGALALSRLNWSGQ